MKTEQPSTLQMVSVRWWNASAYYAISLTEALGRAGVRSVAAGRGSSPPLQKARKLGLPTFTDINLETLHPLYALQSYRKLRNYINQQDFQIINAHRPEDGLFAVLSQRFLSNARPVVRTVSDVRPPKSHPLNRWLHQHGFDHLIFSCRASLERYQAVWPIFEGRSSVIYSAIDTEVFQPAPISGALRQRLGIPKDALVVGIIARLSPVKDHHTFLTAAARVLKKVPDVYFLISGESAQLNHDQLKDYARELGIISHVVFLERDPQLTAKELISEIDIGAVTSRGSEVICRVAVEYMAMGKPQVTSDINVLPEIIEPGRNGFVAPAGDAEAFAAHLLTLIESPRLRFTMGQQARAVAEERFSYPVFVEKTLEVYKEAIRKKMGRT